MDPADVYELVQLDRHTDRILPNGVCLLASLRAIIAALEAGQRPGAVRGAGVPARPGQPVPVTIGKKPEDHGHAC